MLPIAEPELTLVIGTPERIGLMRAFQLAALRPVAAAFAARDKTIVIEYGMDTR